MSLIIVEGLDCTGKTTFVELLQKRLPGALVLRSGPPPSPLTDPFQEYEQRLYDPVDEGRSVIGDRWHWGERAYGPVLRGRDRLGDPGWRHIELFLRTRGAVVVYLHQPLTVLVDRLESRGDDLVEPDHLLPVEVGYQWCLRNTVLPVISLRDPGELAADFVVAVAGATDPRGEAYFPSYVGSRRPKALLFGERRGGRPPHADRSAFVPRRGTSGYYLLDCLPEVLWGHLGLCNALEEDPAEVWTEVGQPPTVALGREAHKALTKAKVPHASVPHPQYVRRFLHAELPEYGRLIQDVIGTERDDLGWRTTKESV